MFQPGRPHRAHHHLRQLVGDVVAILAGDPLDERPAEDHVPGEAERVHERLVAIDDDAGEVEKQNADRRIVEQPSQPPVGETGLA